MKDYVRSGSGAEAGHPQKSTFRFYLRMQFLDEAAQESPYVTFILYMRFKILKMYISFFAYLCCLILVQQALYHREYVMTKIVYRT